MSSHCFCSNANDPEQATRTLMKIAHSDDRQRPFFDSLLSFLATYDFDGVEWVFETFPYFHRSSDGYELTIQQLRFKIAWRTRKRSLF